MSSGGALLQTAYGGYLLTNPSIEEKEELIYSEPGFTVDSPIEFAIPKNDQFYFIIRKRDPLTESNFLDLSAANVIVNAVDVTLGAQLKYQVSNFSSDLSYYDTSWEDGLTDSKKIVLAINSGIPLNEPTVRIRTIDVNIKDLRDNRVLQFRVLVDDGNKVFNYLHVKTNKKSQRNTTSIAARTTTLQIDNKSDSYVLISPFNLFYEVTSGQYDFSYPLGTIFYKKQDTYNKENFVYHIVDHSHSNLIDNMRVFNVPNYPQMGLLLIDRNFYSDMADLSGDIYIEIEVRGLFSEMRDSFIINFDRG